MVISTSRIPHVLMVRGDHYMTCFYHFLDQCGLADNLILQRKFIERYVLCSYYICILTLVKVFSCEGAAQHLHLSSVCLSVRLSQNWISYFSLFQLTRDLSWSANLLASTIKGWWMMIETQELAWPRSCCVIRGRNAAELGALALRRDQRPPAQSVRAARPAQSPVDSRSEEISWLKHISLANFHLYFGINIAMTYFCHDL